MVEKSMSYAFFLVETLIKTDKSDQIYKHPLQDNTLDTGLLGMKLAKVLKISKIV